MVASGHDALRLGVRIGVTAVRPGGGEPYGTRGGPAEHERSALPIRPDYG